MTGGGQESSGAARVLLGVRGMTTPETVRQVKEALLKVEGVTKVEPSFYEQAAVEYDGSSVTVMDLIRALRGAGFTAGME
jgi:copper chaperone CopZ